MKELLNFILAIVYAIFPFLRKNKRVNRQRLQAPAVTEWPIFEDFQKIFPGKNHPSMTFNGNLELSNVKAKLKYDKTSVKIVLTKFSNQDWAFNTIVLEFCTDVPENASIDVPTPGACCNTYHIKLPWNTRLHTVFTDVTTNQLNNLAKSYGFNTEGHFAKRTLLLQISGSENQTFWLPISLDEKHNAKLADWDDLITSSFAQQNKPITLKGLGLEFHIAREVVDYINTTIREHPIEIGSGKQKKLLKSLRISTFKKGIDSCLIKPQYTKPNRS